ncbi:hypothetical protein CI102_11955 [Trichoderma harzianum]|nr:hypothetical protein CI102_11955 [Trichoderma harzianum]
MRNATPSAFFSSFDVLYVVSVSIPHPFSFSFCLILFACQLNITPSRDALDSASVLDVSKQHHHLAFKPHVSPDSDAQETTHHPVSWSVLTTASCCFTDFIAARSPCANRGLGPLCASCHPSSPDPVILFLFLIPIPRLALYCSTRTTTYRGPEICGHPVRHWHGNTRLLLHLHLHLSSAAAAVDYRRGFFNPMHALTGPGPGVQRLKALSRLCI